MDFDKNYMGYDPMIGCMYNCPMQCQKFNNNELEKGVPSYMYGKCMDKWGEKPYMCSKFMNMCDNMPGTYNMRSDMYSMHKKMESIENMCGKTYKILIMHVHKTINKIIVENMGSMPTAISKEKFNKEMNNMICEVMKQEDEIKKIVVVDRSETEEESTDRAFCPFCNGLLKDTLSILFVTELLKGGCTFCY